MRSKVAYSLVWALSVLMALGHMSNASLQNQRIESSAEIEKNVTGAAASRSSDRASKRLMKELVELFKSPSYKNGLLKAKLIEDNLYEWEVNIFVTDPEVPLHADLKRLGTEGKRDFIVLRVSFDQNFPNEPPFVRVVYPTLKNCHVNPTGAICMKLLSKQGWSREFSVESLLLAITSMFLDLGRVNFDARGSHEKTYTDEEARDAFREIAKVHTIHGWHD